MLSMPMTASANMTDVALSAVLGVNVLLLGLEPILQTSRAVILQREGFCCTLADEVPPADTFATYRFRVVILCQSLAASEACVIHERLKHLSPTTTALRITTWLPVQEPCFEYRLVCPTPRQLIEAVRQLAAGAQSYRLNA